MMRRIFTFLSLALAAPACVQAAEPVKSEPESGKCAYVDVDATFAMAKPEARCFNPEMKCKPDEQYGCFKVPLEFRGGWVDGGKLRELSSQFGYIDPDGRHWDVPAGFQTDGASIPLFFQGLIGGPWTESYIKAAVIHDFYIRRLTEKAEAVHKVFYFALRAAGNGQRRAEEMYFAVANFGPQWKHVDVSTFEAAWQTRKAMLDQVTKWHQDVWDAFQASERKREAQAAIDREVLGRPIGQRTKVFELPSGRDALAALDAFVDDAVQGHILHPDRDATLIHLLREQVEGELARAETERDNIFVVQFTSLGPTTVRFAARNKQELNTQLQTIDETTRTQEQSQLPPAICVGDCLRGLSNSGLPAVPGPPRLGP